MNAALWLAAGFALVGCEVAARAYGRGWPNIFQMVQVARRTISGRAVLAVAWLWLGWHVFPR